MPKWFLVLGGYVAIVIMISCLLAAVVLQNRNLWPHPDSERYKHSLSKGPP